MVAGARLDRLRCAKNLKMTDSVRGNGLRVYMVQNFKYLLTAELYPVLVRGAHPDITNSPAWRSSPEIVKSRLSDHARNGAQIGPRHKTIGPRVPFQETLSAHTTKIVCIDVRMSVNVHYRNRYVEVL